MRKPLSVETASILLAGAYASGNARRIATALLDYKRALRAVGR